MNEDTKCGADSQDDLSERLAMNLPDQIKNGRHFLLWKFKQVPGEKKPRKVPHYINGIQRNGTQGAPEDRAHLAPFGEALQALETGSYDGLGIAMLPDVGLVGVDLDNCFHDGVLNPEVAPLVDGTYRELSPSGKGVRAFYLGEYQDRKHLDKGVEIFCKKGFLTLTGDRLTVDDVIPLPIAVRSKLDALFASQRAKSARTEQPLDGKDDPVVQRLAERGMIRKNFGDGRIGIQCPFGEEHTTGDGDADAVYFLAHTNGYELGNFNCLHAHCAERSQDEFYQAIGLSRSGTWPTLAPFENAAPARLPIEQWPPVLRNYAIEASQETETPVELPALLAIGCVAAAIQKVLTVKIKPGYVEPCCINVVLVLPPATRKSAEITRAIAPIVKWEAEQRLHFADAIKRAESLLATHKARVQELRKRAIKERSSDKAIELAAELAALEASEPTIPVSPRLFTSDVTTEHLATMMGNHGGAMAVISSEGGIFETMAGRYSQQMPNFDLYLQAHAGDPVRVDRGSKAPIVLDNPRLTMVLTVQPDVLTAMGTKAGFKGRGLLGRVQFCLPPSTLGHRTGATPRMSYHVQEAYNDVIGELIDVAHTNEPYTLELSTEAAAAWMAFWREVETKLADGEQFEHCRDWAGKLPGAVGRIAALFHSARHPDQLATKKIELCDMHAAISTGWVLAEHALAAFGCMGADPAVEDAKLVLKWILRHRLMLFTVRDVQHNYGSRFAKADDVLPALGVLEDRGYIRQRHRGPGAKGGRPTVAYEVNPIIFN
jgi:hypothetical protein